MKKTITAFIVSIITAPLFAQDGAVQAFTLREAIDYALKNNHDAKNAKLDMQKAKAFNWEIMTQGLPQVNGSFEYDYYFKTPIVPAFNADFGQNSPFAQLLGRLEYIDGTVLPHTTANPYAAPTSPNNPSIGTILGNNANAFSDISFVLPNDITTGITVTQLLFDARYMFGIQARKELYLTSRLQSDLTDQDIKYNITKAYNQAETAQESKALLLDNMKIVEKILSDTRAVFAQGLTEDIDVTRLELAQANLQSQITMQNNLADVAMANLKFQMGLSLNQVIILKDKLDDLKATIVPSQNKFDPKNRVEYQLLSTGITLKGYDIAQKRSGYYPSLAGFVNYSGNVQTQEFSDMFKANQWYPQGIIGIKLNVPIFDSGLKMMQVKQTKIEQLKLKNDFDNFKNAAELQYESANSNYSAALADEVNSQKSLDLSKKIYDKNQVKFKQGAGTSFELEQSEQEYTTNLLKHMQSVMNLLNTKADLDKAMGVK